MLEEDEISDQQKELNKAFRKWFNRWQ
jgi:hypothetical protein